MDSKDKVINDLLSRIATLEWEIERLNNIINEVREYVKWDYDRNEEVIDYCNFNDFYKHILEILDKENK